MDGINVSSGNWDIIWELGQELPEKQPVAARSSSCAGDMLSAQLDGTSSLHVRGHTFLNLLEQQKI